MTHCNIKRCQQKYPFMIFLFHCDKCVFGYDWQICDLWLKQDAVLDFVKPPSGMSYRDWTQFLAHQVSRHFEFKASNTDLVLYRSQLAVEEYFTLKPHTTY